MSVYFEGYIWNNLDWYYSNWLFKFIDDVIEKYFIKFLISLNFMVEKEVL